MNKLVSFIRNTRYAYAARNRKPSGEWRH